MKKKLSPEMSGSVVITRQEHGISRKVMSPNALRVLYRLKDNGFVAHLVGGCVRDLLLGREPKDFDVVTNATPGEVKKLFRSCRLVGRRFRLAHIHFHEELIEVATFRSQAPDEPEPGAKEKVKETRGREQRQPHTLKDDEGMILRDNVFGTPEEDALRRDFTVNALAYDIADFSIIDYVGGLADLNAGIIRTIGDPEVRFQEDPVRMLRAVRFAALLGFTMAEETRKALVASADTIVRASPPRLYEEMLKILLSGEGAKCCDLLRQTGLFAALFPEFSAWLDAESDGFPHTRFGEMLACVDAHIQSGEKISQPLLLALLFGQYLDEKAEKLRANGAPWQQSVDAATAEFLGEVCPFVLITKGVGFALRDIIAQQMRLKQVPGRRPHLFVARRDFSDIIAYCRIVHGHRKDVAGRLEWWRGQAEQLELEPLPPLVERTGESGAPPRKKRRRRRRKPQGANQAAP